MVQGVGNALARIVKEEGVGGLFTGAGPTVVRAMALNMGMLASNDQVRGCGVRLRVWTCVGLVGLRRGWAGCSAALRWA